MSGTVRDGARRVNRGGWTARGAALLLACVALLWCAPARADDVGLEPPAQAVLPADVTVGDAAPWLVVPTPAGDLVYAPGRGLRVGDTGFHLGGYTNLNLFRPEGGPTSLGLDDLAFFLSWQPLARLQLFSEVELEDLFEVRTDGFVGNPDFRVTTERLYADVAVTDAASVRVGKFLTPVGRWNLIHAQPLTWTSSRPLATEQPFDPHTTGAMVFGSFYPGRGTVEYALFGQFMNQFDPVPTASPAQRSGGARLEYTDLLGWSVGATWLASENVGDWRQLFGVDGLWRHDRLELMGELAVDDGQSRRDDQWGLYLQAAVETLPRVWVVARYEHYDWRAQQYGPDVNLFLGGLAIKPLPWLVLKTEYLAADRYNAEAPPGYRASIAVLF